MERTKKSHIQIPKFILRKFENNEHRLHYLSIYDSKIYRGYAKTLNTKLGYYSNETEEILNTCIETPFSRVVEKILKHDFSSNLDITQKENVIIKDFLVSLLSRNPQMYNEIKNNSVFLQFMSIEDVEKHDFAVDMVMQYGRNLFDDYYVFLVKNITHLPFVLPMCGVYHFTYNDHNANIFPFSPEFAFMLLPKELAVHWVKDNTRFVILINDEQYIRKFNLYAYLEQKEMEYPTDVFGGWVASNNEDVLKLLALDIVANG